MPVPSSKKRWIIVSNRLPFSVDPEGQVVRSSGGLVTAISGIRSDGDKKLWVGTAPKELDTRRIRQQNEDSDMDYLPVHIPDATYDLYYNGFSNDVIWPLFHYETDIVKFNWEGWNAYKKVNQNLAKVILENARDDDLIWIHDFHLMLLPKLLKAKNKKLRVGFFLHIPFPSSEIFRQLPVRREILEALLSSDLIGFHDYSYLRHFCMALQSILGLESSLLTVKTEGRTVRLGVFPVSIDSKRFQTKSKSKSVAKVEADFRKNKTYKHLVLGVDRLDYTKGIDLKLLAYREMLRNEPQLRGNVSLLQIAVPSRMDVPEYMRLKTNIDKLVGEINGEFGRPNYTPVQYLFSSVSFNELVALYRVADILLVTSKRDGMNLVSLEYLASQEPSDPGVAMLSEFAGAISTLSHVMPINPWDVVGTGKRLAHCLGIEKRERTEKHALMIKYLEGYSATDWAKSFMVALGKTKQSETSGQEEIKASGTSVVLPGTLREKIKNRPITLLTDYDGTLVPIEDSPEQATLDKPTRAVLKSLIKKKNFQMVVVSGRNSRFLSQQFDELGVSMAAEHGAKFYSKEKKRWMSLVHSNTQSWYPIALKIMKDYAGHVPGSIVEKKEHSISWHYRKSPPGFAGYQSRKLREELELGLSNQPVTILAGKKVIEARAIEANKGAFARWLMDTQPGYRDDSVIVAVGDDLTDEDLFASMPEDSVTIKVGEGATFARYRLKSQEGLVPLIKKLVN